MFCVDAQEQKHEFKTFHTSPLSAAGESANIL